MASVIKDAKRKSAEPIVIWFIIKPNEGANPAILINGRELAGCVRRACPVGSDRDYLIAITARQTTKERNIRNLRKGPKVELLIGVKS